MVKIYKHSALKNGRLYIMYCLLFLLVLGCKHPEPKIELVWKGDRAVAISIPKGLIKGFSEVNIASAVRVVNPDSKGKGSILGNISLDGDNIVFTPLIPLTPDMSYNVLSGGVLLGTVRIRMTSNDNPQVVAVYPEADTIPENTLKLYLHFSKPMRTGKALEYVYLLDKNKDTMRNVFLNLQPELWDTSGTVLTLWLDPGRIKRGLVLNRELGNPLKKSEHYQLVVSQQWKDTRGLTFAKAYSKQFSAGERDAEIPDINKWEFNQPKAGTMQSLIIDVGESLDHYLLQEAVEVIDANGEEVKGKVALNNHDRQYQFTPSQAWKAGIYKLKADSKLEDLAGNNLNRVFDRDITKDKQQNKAYFERSFELK